MAVVFFGFFEGGWVGKGTRQIATKEQVHVILVMGDLLKQNVETIGNLTSKKLDLGDGDVSKMILKKGGQRIQKEIKKKKLNSIKPGEICTTSAGKLPYQKIYHGTCEKYSSPTAKGDMMKHTLASLEQADKDGITSIAFSSLGTGKLSFPACESANIMYEAVKKFSQSHPNTKLKDIRIVIYNEENMMKDYEAVMAALPKLYQQKRKKVTRRLHPDSYALFFKPSKPVRHSGVGTAPYVLEAGSTIQTELTGSFTMVNCTLFEIIAQSQDAIEQAKRSINTRCNQMSKESVLKDKIIKNLSKQQVTKIQKLDDAYPAVITVTQGSVNAIVIKSTDDVIVKVLEQIQDVLNMLREMEKQILQNNGVRTWQYKDEDGFENYPTNINSIIETAFSKEKKSVEWNETDEKGLRNWKLKLLFSENRETRPDEPGYKADIRFILTGVELPHNWDPMDKDVLAEVTLQPKIEEYEKVKANFDNGLKKYNLSGKVHKIIRIQNRNMYSKYMTTQTHMMEANSASTKEVERTLWHATKRDVVDEINANGFNRSFCGEAHGTRYGKGVYFATHAGYSVYRGYAKSDDQMRRYIYQVKVLTGDYTVASAKSKCPPAKDPSNPSNKYDSVVDDMTDMKEWVIFQDFQSYPEYLIIFECDIPVRT